eukprot:712876-Pyramimonas_sp.AAC.2
MTGSTRPSKSDDNGGAPGRHPREAQLFLKVGQPPLQVSVLGLAVGDRSAVRGQLLSDAHDALVELLLMLRKSWRGGSRQRLS